MEGDNDTFFDGDGALRQLVGPMRKKYSMTFNWGHPFSTCESYDRFSNLSHIRHCVHMQVFRLPPTFAHVILLIWYHPLPFWLCPFDIVSSYYFISEIQEFVTHLEYPNRFFLSQAPTSSWHLIQFPLAYLG